MTEPGQVDEVVIYVYVTASLQRAATIMSLVNIKILSLFLLPVCVPPMGETQHRGKDRFSIRNTALHASPFLFCVARRKEGKGNKALNGETWRDTVCGICRDTESANSLLICSCIRAGAQAAGGVSKGILIGYCVHVNKACGHLSSSRPQTSYCYFPIFSCARGFKICHKGPFFRGKMFCFVEAERA